MTKKSVCLPSVWIRVLVAMEASCSSLWRLGYKRCRLRWRVLGLRLFITTCGLWIEQSLRCRFCFTCGSFCCHALVKSHQRVPVLSCQVRFKNRHFLRPFDWVYLSCADVGQPGIPQAAAVVASTYFRVQTSKYVLLIFRSLSLCTGKWERANDFLQTPDPPLTYNTNDRWAAMD